MPARVLLQDFTGVPAIVDLAAMRDAMADLGGDPARVNPLVPADLVIDHSVQVDRFGTPGAFAFNVEREYERNGERYQLLRWAQTAFRDLRVVPPGTGIVHQVNLEFLATVVDDRDDGDGGRVAFPDTLVGTDSHTTMINGLGVLGYGVGGIEAEAVLLGQPLYQPMPHVVGVRLTGELPQGSTATDLVLVVTEMLRRHGVVGAFVEFAGDGLAGAGPRRPRDDQQHEPRVRGDRDALPDRRRDARLPAPDRPHAGARRPRRALRQGAGPVARARRRAGLRRAAELDLATVEPSVAGPRRPQDRVPLTALRDNFRSNFPDGLDGPSPSDRRGADRRRWRRRGGLGRVVPGSDPPSFAAADAATPAPPAEPVAAGAPVDERAYRPVDIEVGGQRARSGPGRSPSRRSRRAPTPRTRRSWSEPDCWPATPWRAACASRPTVKTSLAPGSKAVTGYLEAAGLMAPLEALGFALAGYGCTTCIGNSRAARRAGRRGDRGERPRRRGRPVGQPQLRGPDPPAGPRELPRLAAAGRGLRPGRSGRHRPHDASHSGTGTDGRPVFLADIWPAPDEIRSVIADSLDPELFRRTYAMVFEGDDRWRALPIPSGDRYAWDGGSTYIAKPPFFEGLTPRAAAGQPTSPAPASWPCSATRSPPTTSHRPAPSRRGPPPANGSRPTASGPLEFNSYGARRGQHEVMVRGTFANIRLRNQLVEGKEGPYTVHLPDGRGGLHLRRRDALRGRGRPARDHRRARVRLGLIARLGGQGSGAARGQGRDRRELRADPSLEPGRHGRSCRSSSSPATAPARWA